VTADRQRSYPVSSGPRACPPDPANTDIQAQQVSRLRAQRPVRPVGTSPDRRVPALPSPRRAADAEVERVDRPVEPGRQSVVHRAQRAGGQIQASGSVQLLRDAGQVGRLAGRVMDAPRAGRDAGPSQRDRVSSEPSGPGVWEAAGMRTHLDRQG